MHNELLHIGPLTVYTYGLMIAIGILAAFYVTDWRGKKLGMNMEKLDMFTMWILIGGFAGSKILYWITRFQDILQDPSILLSIGDGWVVYGGIIGGILAGYVYCRYQGLDFWKWFDLVIPQVALAQGFGRIGCFFAGCCYGHPTDAWFGIVFPEGSSAPAGIPLFPTQLISSLYDFGMFFLLWWLSDKMKFKGELAAWYLILYSAGRFIIEFYRGDIIRGGVGMFSTSQIIALLCVLAGVIILFAGRRHTQKPSAA